MTGQTRTAERPWRALLLLPLVGWACGSKDDTSGEDPSMPPSRVDVSKALGSLTPDEQKTLCEDVASWLAPTRDPGYIKGNCTLLAISSASIAGSSQNLTLDQMREACRTNESQCEANAAMTLPSSRGCAYPAACGATVRDLRACTVGTYRAALALYATLPSCDQMQPDSAGKNTYSIEQSAGDACKRVTACGPPA
jgi:hypothetical protein